MDAKRIIIAKEKHSTRYFDASTVEDWAASSLKILTERFNDGWYDEDDDTAFYAQVKRLVEAQDASDIVQGRREYPFVWGLLLLRSDYEYERVSLEELE